ncbi:g11455 [Coccomyxa elongata]
MAAFLFKVFTLTIRTVSKPLAARVQSYVLQHPTLRKPVIDLAQALHRLEVRVNRGAEGKSGKVFVGSLSEDKAMDLAGKFISEAFVWGVAIAIVGLEYERQKGKDMEKAAKEKAFQEKDAADKRWLANELEEVRKATIRLNERLVELAADMEKIRLGKEDEERQKLKRSNSFYGVFGLSS